MNRSRYLITISGLAASSLANASLIDYFRFPDGSTNWQYIANFSSSLLILLLSITLLFVYLNHRRALRANRELREIRRDLEKRVEERTQTLNEYNALLQKTNRLLEHEVSDHKSTAARLQVSETYLRQVLESMPLLLVGVDPEMKVTHWNKQAELRTGVTEAAARGKMLWDVFPNMSVGPDQVRQVLESGRPRTVKFAQRGQYYYDITLYPLPGEEPTGAVILIDDVTQQTLTENMLIQRDKISAMGELAATMACDIEPPMRALLDSLKRISTPGAGGGEPEADGGDEIATALAKGEQIAEIVNNLLQFAAGQRTEKRIVRVPEVIDHSLKLANTLLTLPSGRRFRDVVVQRDYADPLPAVPAYESELQQVFLSLFRHACHAFERGCQIDGEPRLAISVFERDDAVWVQFTHNGCPLTEQQQQDLFEPFFVNPESGEGPERDWLRLSFSHFIVTEHHKGQLAVTSDDRGTTFHLQLRPG